MSDTPYTPKELRNWAATADDLVVSTPHQLRAHAALIEQHKILTHELAAKTTECEAYKAENAAKLAEIKRLLDMRDTALENARKHLAAREVLENALKECILHADQLEHYTDCYASKWPHSGANYARDEYRAWRKDHE